MIFEIKMSIVKGPVSCGGMQKEWGAILKSGENTQDERVR